MQQSKRHVEETFSHADKRTQGVEEFQCQKLAKGQEQVQPKQVSQLQINPTVLISIEARNIPVQVNQILKPQPQTEDSIPNKTIHKQQQPLLQQLINNDQPEQNTPK